MATASDRNQFEIRTGALPFHDGGVAGESMFSNCGLSSKEATRDALARARTPVDAIPSTTIARPRPTLTQKKRWVAAAKSWPRDDSSPVPASEPASATPSEAPTCRLVVATADASPACDRGMP